MPIVKEKKEELVRKYGANADDCGRTEVQVALLTEHINLLSGHLEKNKNDNHSRVGLMKMVGNRRRFLNYLMQEDMDRYRSIIKSLNLRK